MVFSSLVFLCIFFPVQMIVYYLARKTEARNVVLILFSVVFYAWGEPFFVVMLLAMSFTNWLLSQYIWKLRETGKSKLFLVITLTFNISVLAFFKYAVFVMKNTQQLFGVPEIIPQIALPIGISFYTFQLTSYIIDVYRQEIPAQPKFHRLLLYVCLFHQSIAGPIVRYQDISEQIIERYVSLSDMRRGIDRFCVGLAKKVLLANACGALADSILLGGAPDPSGVNTQILFTVPALTLWVGGFAYMLQIYLDFSAYSDMAIGMGMMIGFQYRENFDYPYIAKTVTDFWRRWHMSLSTFFRDYLYIPLGGSRAGTAITIRNLFIVWLLTGMWHGAGWNFIMWGIYYFLLLVIEKFILEKALVALPGFITRFYTMAIVFFGWILFYFQEVSHIMVVTKGLFGLNGNVFTNFESTNLLMSNIVFLVVAAVGCTPLASRIYNKIIKSDRATGVGAFLQWGLPVAAIVFSVSFLVSETYNPFLYLQF